MAEFEELPELCIAAIPSRTTPSFQLERKSGKKCYMLAAAASLTFFLSNNDPNSWNWMPNPRSRFPKVAELLSVWWFEIHGMINMLELSPNTQYQASLVFKMSNNSFGFQNRRYSVEISPGVEGGVDCTKICYFYSTVKVIEKKLPNPIVRSDEWLEIEIIGEFFNSGLENKKFLMNIKEMNQICKGGLSIENREKYHSHGYLSSRSFKNERRENEMSFHSPCSSQQVAHQFENENEGHSKVRVSLGFLSETDSSNVQESSPISSGLDENSLHASSFGHLQLLLEQLDVRTKLCIRDSLYRLAKSAEQRLNNSNSNCCIGDGTGACKDTMAQDASR